MKLRYLTLCADFFNKGLTYTADELHSMRVRLAHESAYITDYIKRGANGEFNFNCARINLVCTLPPIREKTRKIESVHEIDVPFNLDYFSMSPKQKEEYLIDVTENGLKRFCDAEGWDFSVFQKHINALRSNSSSAEFYVPQKPCRKGHLSAKVYCVQNMTETVYFMDFFFKRTLIQRKFFAVSCPMTNSYRSNIYRMEWSDDKTVSVYCYGSTDRLYAQVSLDEEIPQSGKGPNDLPFAICIEQIKKVNHVKMLLCEAIGISSYDCNIEVWKENPNGQIFIILSLLEQGPHRYFGIVDASGSVVFEFCDDYLAKASALENFKKQHGWL